MDTCVSMPAGSRFGTALPSEAARAAGGNGSRAPAEAEALLVVLEAGPVSILV